MPCQDYPSDGFAEARELKRDLDRVTSLLCHVMTRYEKKTASLRRCF